MKPDVRDKTRREICREWYNGELCAYTVWCGIVVCGGQVQLVPKSTDNFITRKWFEAAAFVKEIGRWRKKGWVVKVRNVL